MPEPDRLRLTWVGHATVSFEQAGLRFLTDPFLRDRLGPLRRHGAPVDLASIAEPDVVLLSHAHPDHFDRLSLRRLTGDPLVIVPTGLGRVIERMGFRAQELAPDQAVALDGVVVRAVEARHGRWPRHPSAITLGYLVEGPLRIYFAGDTSAFPGQRALAGRVDVALLPIGSWGPHRAPWHLGPRGAARLASTIDARVVVPIHWGTLYPSALARVWGGPLDTPARQFQAACADLAPRAEARVLRPGDSTVIEVLDGLDGPGPAPLGRASA